MQNKLDSEEHILKNEELQDYNVFFLQNDNAKLDFHK